MLLANLNKINNEKKKLNILIKKENKYVN